MSYAISCLSDIAIFWLVLVPYIIICIATAKLLVCCASFGRLSSVQTLMLDAFKLGSFFLMVSSSRLLRLSSHFLVIGSLFCLSIELYALLLWFQSPWACASPLTKFAEVSPSFNQFSCSILNARQTWWTAPEYWPFLLYYDLKRT